MKVFVKLAILLIFAVGVQGCATHGIINGVPSEDQKSVFKDGRKTLMSTKRNTVIVAAEAEIVKSGQREGFIIAVNNGTNQDIPFSTEEITATVLDETSGQKTALKVFNYEELVREEKKRQAWAAVSAALGGVSDSIAATNAGYSRTSGTYSGSAYSGYGTGAYGYGRYSSTTYNPAAAQAAQNVAKANSEERFAQLRAEGRENLQNLSSAILKKETIFPGAWYGGIVKVKLPEVTETRQEIQLFINVAGEMHIFTFFQEKVERR